MGKMKKRGTFLGMNAHRTDRPLIQKRPPSKFPVLWLWALGLWSVLSSGSLAQDFSATESQASVLDATLHDCLMLSIDRAFAVGDAGAILLTEDGGKQWKSLQPLRSEMNYYAIGMDDPVSLGVAQGALPQRSGLIVGGTLQPATGRSIGTVLTTQDDGKTWTPSVIPGLPRLIGLQRIKHRHWIAWGDWSDHFASSLFESIDGGKSWSPRKIPCGHLQGVAVSSDGATLLVDRTSRVFFATDGVDFKPVDIDTDAFRPIRFCKLQSQGWWIGGDGAQLWHSPDAVNWTSVKLPIDPQDASLVDCLQMVGKLDRLWVVGKPGNVLWSSDDQGRSWERLSTATTTVLLDVDALDDQVLMACGRLGHILQSRNAGRSWRESHASAERYLGLSLSATDQTIPWDALGFIVHEGLHHSAAVVIHDRRFTERLHHQIDRNSALECLASRAHLDHVSVLPGYPVSDLPSGSKVNDLGYYHKSGDHILRKMIQEIRLHRPDVLLIEDISSPNMLHSANGALASQAAQLAGNPSYSPTKSLGQDQPSAWTVQRIIQRSESNGGFLLSPSMLLKKSNQLLAKPLQPIRYFYGASALAQGGEPPEAIVGKAHYRLVDQKSVTINNPLDGLVIKNDTKLADKPLLKVKLATLMASASSGSKVTELLQTRGSQVYRENAWDEALVELIKPLSPESALDVLWMVSQESRIQGNWHRWYTALQMIQARYPKEEQQEMVYRELMTYTGSAEVDRMIRDQMAKLKQDDQPSASTPQQVASAASPFASSDNSVVKPAAHASPIRLTPIARGASEKEFAKQLGEWPEEWKTKQQEPSWAWLIASRFRTSSYNRTGKLDPSAEREFWPPYFPQLGNWSGIHEQELIVNTPPEGSLPIPRIPWISHRPHLDGKPEPELWTQAMTMRLSTAWTDQTDTSIVRICRDQEFLFLHISSPRSRTSELAASATLGPKSGGSKKGLTGLETKTKRDSMDARLEHVSLKIDIDRDYATWFEFAWDIQGGLLDRCNDVPVWDPQWYIAFAPSDEAWNAELAIPISELLSESSVPWEQLPWALSIQRERPSLSTEFLVAGDNDRWGRDQWLILNPAVP